ncbi:MAG: DUF4445 domain-containing protein [Candidatus Hydrogenedentes bacterium]|nr:DUF4445 domain-containing protein [Candidatus Hydrogenedentota bacterium]
MDGSKVAVTFQPQGKHVRVPKGTTIREASARAGIVLDYPCGGQGTCGKCRVRVVENVLPPHEKERSALRPHELDAGLRLACQSAIQESTVIEIPETSLLASTYKILADAQDENIIVTDPPVHKRYIELTKPSLEDTAPDLDRVRRAYGRFDADLDMLRSLPRRLRETNFAGTAVVSDGQLIDFEPGNTERECFAAAFDIGTTTLVGSLIDLTSGAERATTSRMNPQTSHGDDVLSRILHARDDQDGLAHLHDAVVNAVNEMIGELVTQAGTRLERVYEVTFAGNTTMQHMLLSISPNALGEVPFVSAMGPAVEAAASQFGVRIHPRGRGYVFPVIGGFVGGDTIAGMLATGLANYNTPTLFIDIGTNGEIVLINEGKLLAASCAAGPAFEGARIGHGMRAAVGAIEEVRLNDRIDYATIGDAKPVGICGSALIDLAAELLRTGIVMSQGMLLTPDLLPSDIPEDIRRRIRPNEAGGEFVLVDAHETQTGAPIVLTQRDIRELQLATGAIRAGIAILLRNGGVAPEALDRVLVAGAFGNYIRCENAQRMGLLPSQVDRARIQFVGNTSLTGARLVATSLRARELAEDLRRRTQHIDLACDPNFQMEFAEAMFFPEVV